MRHGRKSASGRFYGHKLEVDNSKRRGAGVTVRVIDYTIGDGRPIQSPRHQTQIRQMARQTRPPPRLAPTHRTTHHHPEH
jgi:hypothetical protein